MVRFVVSAVIAGVSKRPAIFRNPFSGTRFYAASSVWVQIFYEGDNEPSGQPVKIEPIPEDVHDLKGVVHARKSKSLQQCDPDDLVVYPPKTHASGNRYKPGKPLKELIDELENTTPPTSDFHPLIVVAPAPQQQPEYANEAQFPSRKRRPVDRPDFFGIDNDKEWELYMENQPSVDKGASEFLRRIAEADVNLLGPVTAPDWNWPELTNAENSISVIKVDFPADEEAMGDGITMVQLPLPNPALPISSRSDRIFVRNEDVGLIRDWSSPKKQLIGTEIMRIRSVVLGNPGISKSWHLWKYLLMAANSNLWKQITGEDEFPCQPKVIAFVTSGASVIRVRVYYLNENVVHQFRNLDVLESLNALSTNGSVRMLYEPASSFRPVPHDLHAHNRIPCVAALSPFLRRYKEYLKQYDQAAPHIMPCPTWSEIEAIARFLYWKESDEGMAAFVQTVRERYLTVGPFLRILFAPEKDYESYLSRLRGQFRNMSLEKAHAALTTIEAGVEATLSNPSHMIARYITPKSYEGDFTIGELVPASQITQNRIMDCLEKETTERLRAIMVHYEEGTFDNESNPKALETLLCKYIRSSEGLKWPYCQCQITFNTRDKDLKATSTGQNALDLKKRSVCYSSSLKASEMTVDEIYQPRDMSYPFVDLLWIDETIDSATAGTAPPVSAIQCTISNSHARGLSAYEDLRERLGMSDEQTLVVYIATLPRCVESYLVGPKSTFFKHTTKLSFPENIEFRVLLPPKDMKNSNPDSDLYEVAMDKVYK